MTQTPGGSRDPGLLAVPAMSPNGQFVVFVSKAIDIVPGISDPSGAANVYLRNLQTGVTTLVSVDAAGTAAGNGNSGYDDFFISGETQSAVSPDGQFVAFSMALRPTWSPVGLPPASMSERPDRADDALDRRSKLRPDT